MSGSQDPLVKENNAITFLIHDNLLRSLRYKEMVNTQKLSMSDKITILFNNRHPWRASKCIRKNPVKTNHFSFSHFLALRSSLLLLKSKQFQYQKLEKNQGY